MPVWDEQMNERATTVDVVTAAAAVTAADVVVVVVVSAADVVSRVYTGSVQGCKKAKILEN